MSGFTVEGQAIDELGTAFTGSANALEALDIASPFSKVGDALPGSQTAVATTVVSVKLAASVRVVGDHVRAMARSADESARAYLTADSSSGRRFGPIGVL